MGFREGWINWIYRTATASKKYRTFMTPVGFLMFASFLTLMVLLSLLIDRLLHFPKIFRVPWNAAVYWPLIVIGLFLMVWSVSHFVRVKGTPVPFNPPPKLVTNGPYAYVRNPMLTGVFIAMFGLGLALGSITLAFIMTPILFVLNYLELTKIEEPELEMRLGQEYIEYKKHVPMFWPRLKKRKS